MRTPHWLPLTGLLALSGALSGCTGLFHSDAPALQLYVLQPAATSAAPVARPSVTASLRIMRPLPAAGLNTDRIALLRPGNRLDYYAGSRWSAPLADVLADLELATFNADPAWNAVADDRSSFNAQYLLQTSVDRFTADYATEAGPPVVQVSLHCLLIRRSDGSLLGSFAVTQSVPAQENRVASVIGAFQQAAGAAVTASAVQSDQLLRSEKSPGSP
jgi:ABC-type uncharacterized transport system auxiliary subunit